MLLDDNAPNRRIGITLVCLTTLLFALLDTCAKWLLRRMGAGQGARRPVDSRRRGRGGQRLVPAVVGDQEPLRSLVTRSTAA